MNNFHQIMYNGKFTSNTIFASIMLNNVTDFSLQINTKNISLIPNNEIVLVVKISNDNTNFVELTKIPLLKVGTQIQQNFTNGVGLYVKFIQIELMSTEWGMWDGEIIINL